MIRLAAKWPNVHNDLPTFPYVVINANKYCNTVHGSSDCEERYVVPQDGDYGLVVTCIGTSCSKDPGSYPAYDYSMLLQNNENKQRSQGWQHVNETVGITFNAYIVVTLQLLNLDI